MGGYRNYNNIRPPPVLRKGPACRAPLVRGPRGEVRDGVRDREYGESERPEDRDS